ncbi:hypothetical protein [Microbacterium dauci]|uniref:Uncharacterized protein n=1 Tax=Microbacterium dauci TaxID=3048008 RepID=A0ABT6ZEM9_9MICO|nr:hypothetical protein [Microbacterium sp. LX3-4]MDJ1114603.1 hypothetical protein [Microbacterium sp. LX3-4]
MTDVADRYDGKPLLRFLDAYVLDALGALDEKTAALAVAMKDKTAAALGVEGDTWQEVIERAMAMPPGAREQLQALWEQHVVLVTEAGQTPDVVAFAHATVDATFLGAGPAQR